MDRTRTADLTTATSPTVFSWRCGARFNAIRGGAAAIDPMPTEAYLPLVIREFTRLKKLADDAMAQVSSDQFFAVPGTGDNSIAVIVKHLAGNLVSRWTDLLTSDGEKPHRDRDSEFQILESDTRELLSGQWEQGWRKLFDTLAPLHAGDLDRTITIRGEPLTVLQAINRQLTHYAYHVGQIVYVAKHQRGASWHTLSIPLGGSAQFNRQPQKYVPTSDLAPERQ